MAAPAHPGEQLAAFAAALRAEAIPAAVLERAEDLMIDWLGSALAGKGARPVETIVRFAERMGPADGPSEVLIHRRGTSPLLAAMANAAASHVAEQDDLHNGSVLHPATVVFPPALAVAQALGRSGAELLAAVVAGYEVGIRVGEFLGARTTPSSTPRAPPERSPPRRPSATCSASTPTAWRTPSARPARRPPASGSSCAKRPTRSSCTPRTPRRRD
jgi:2-methylcitrate dehydratase PrpD